MIVQPGRQTASQNRVCILQYNGNTAVDVFYMKLLYTL
jgi:hypothetical protein